MSLQKFTKQDSEVLNLIEKSGPLSKEYIARILGKEYSEASKEVDQLRQQDEITAVGVAKNRCGKPSKLYQVKS